MIPRQLQARRTERCRLAPAFALQTTDDALMFLADRKLLTLTPSSSLPSLFGACHEEPYAPGKGGYGQYPRTRWWWGGWLADEPGVVATKLARGRQLFMDRALAEQIAPLPRRELARADAGQLGDDAAQLVSFLGDYGVANVAEVKAALGWEAARLRRARSSVEKWGAVLSRGAREDIDEDGGHRHTAELQRWDHAIDAEIDGDADGALATLLTAGVRAAVIAPDTEVRRWFSWSVSTAQIDRLIADGRVERLDGGFVAAPT
jgi:hypothetical protein